MAASVSYTSKTVGETLVGRDVNFSKWYKQVVKQADLAVPSAVPGCMVIKPLGCAWWEQVHAELNRRFKESKSCEELSFPLLIPLSLFAKEAEHVSGFAPECAIVTHYRLTSNEKGIMEPDPAAKLKEPLIVRPTSEMIIGEAMHREIRSYRDLPVKWNQWVNVVRWEHRTNPFVRTKEFQWQEGHCAFASEEEARENALGMAELYQAFMTDACALPVIMGEKSPGERFAGAEQTYCLEAMMGDGKALQAATSHYLGQNFAKALEIQFVDKKDKRHYAYTTSWGLSTRIIGAMIMVHGDDAGLRIPPYIAPHQVVIIPSGIPSQERDEYIQKVSQILKGSLYKGALVRCHLDERKRDMGDKVRDWVVKGAPLRLDIGPQEMTEDQVTVYRRDQDWDQKTVVKLSEIGKHVVHSLEEIQQVYSDQAKLFLRDHVHEGIQTLDDMRAFFSNPDKKGFVRAKWCGERDTEAMLKDLGVTIRCLPFDQTKTEGVCVLTGKPAVVDAIFGKSY